MAEDKKSPSVKPAGTVDLTGKPPRATVTAAPTLAERVLYADGVQGISVRAGVARIDLYQVTASASSKEAERRVVTQRLALPASALGELARSLKALDEAMRKARAARTEKPEG